MEEAIKDRIILILGILAVIFFISSVSSCNNAFRNRSARDKEMASRLDLEEKVSKLSQENSALEQRLDVAGKELVETKANLDAANKDLAQEKEELQKMTKLKETLEEDLKEALVKGKATKAKK